jgi:hypothetical protein
MQMETLKRLSQVLSTDVATVLYNNRQCTVRPTYLRDGKQAVSLVCGE